MKKLRILTSLAVVFVLASVLFLASCSKDDTTAPSVTINGSDMTIVLNGTAPSDPGASASDDKDGSLTASSDWSSTNPNVNLAGNYTITYTATDAAGNVGTAHRTVTVRNDADDYIGAYTTTEPPNPTWTQSITSSTTENNKIKFSKFANYSGNTNITAMIVTVSSDKYVVLNPASQSASGIGSDGCNHIFAPAVTNGAKITQVGGKWTFSVKFTDTTTGPGTTTCAPTSAQPWEDTFVHN